MGCINSTPKKQSIPLPHSRNGYTSSSHSNGSVNVRRNPSLSNTLKQKIVIALYSYEGRDERDLSFEKGDKLIIIDDREPDWWLAQRVETEERGYIPMNFVASNIMETEEYLSIQYILCSHLN